MGSPPVSDLRAVLFDYAHLDAADRESLGRALAEHTTLEQVLDWGRTQQPPFRVDSVLTQDEYTHDVLIPYGQRYLVFDTT